MTLCDEIYVISLLEQEAPPFKLEPELERCITKFGGSSSSLVAPCPLFDCRSLRLPAFVMPTYDDITITIQVDGADVPEFLVERDQVGKKVTCWVPSQIGKVRIKHLRTDAPMSYKHNHT